MAIVLSVILWFADYDYIFGIFKLFLIFVKKTIEDTKGVTAVNGRTNNEAQKNKQCSTEHYGKN